MIALKNNVDTRLVAQSLLQVPSLVEDANSNREFTSMVQKVLYDLGNRLGYTGFCHPAEGRKSNEWMCDAVWLEKPPSLTAVLAAESEWGSPKCVLDDFQKLLSFKAPLKVLLYAFKKDSKQLQEVREGIQNYLEKYPYHLAGEEYLFIEYKADGNSAEIVRIAKDEQHSGFEFRAA